MNNLLASFWLLYIIMAFAEVSEDTINELLETKDSKSTKRTVARSVKTFRDYLANKNVSSEFEDFSKTELNEHLRLFYASIRKRGGDMMKKNTITSLKYGIAKYLKENVDIDINKDSEFASSTAVFSAVLTDLKKKGFASVQHKPAICKEDLLKLYDYENVALNPNTPSGLLNKTWFDVMTFLCRRGRENLREMTRDTFTVSIDGSGRRFVSQVNTPRCNFISNLFSAVLTDLKKKGFASVQHKPAICKEDLLKLYDYENVALNPNTPSGLLNKTWFDVMTFLCRRGRENLREMTRDTFTVSIDGSGRRFVSQVQDENNKNHTVKDDPNDTIGEGRMYERVGDPMCPVNSVIKYNSKLNPDNDAFWQQPSNRYEDADPVWYTRAPLGKNTLSSMMSNISKLAKLSMIYTNHSIRATSITEMDEGGIDTRHIMRVSGHKCEASIKNYVKRLSDRKKREISDCLSETLTTAEKDCKNA